MPGEGGAQVASPLAMLMPYLQMGLSWMLDSAVSGKFDLLKFSNMDPSRSVAANFQNAYESNLQKRMFGYAMQRQSEEQSRRIIEAGYRVLGYDQPSAYYESKKTGAGIVGWAVDTFLGDQWNEGLSTMYGSAFGRRAFDRSGRYRMRNDYQQLGDELLKMHYEQGAFGNASFSEVGGVAAALINSGRYDDFGRGMRSTVNSKNQFVDENGNVLQEGDARLAELKEKDPYGTGYWQRNANGPATLIRRADVISKDVKEYTRALTKLQDVIGGDMTQIMDTLDKLFGTSATAISADRLDNLTSSLRQSMHATGASLQQMATLGATAFSYIAPFGGTENNANRVAVDTTFVTNAGTVEEGTNPDMMGAETARVLSNKLISGEVGNIAVAYNFWAKQSGLDVHDPATYARFKKATAGRKWKEADMLNFMHEVAPNASNEVFEAALRDTDAAKLADEFNIGMEALVEQSHEIEQKEKANLTELTQEINKMTGENMTVEELFGEDWATTSTAKVRERAGKKLIKMGYKDAAIVAESKVIQALQNPAVEALGIANGATARNIRINAIKGERAQEQETYQDQIKNFFGNAAKLADTGTEGGLGGVFQALRMGATNDEQKTEITDLFFGAMGLTKEQVEAYNKGEINSAEDIDELLDKNAGTIAETYKRVFGKEYTGKDKQGAAKELLKKFSDPELQKIIAPFIGGTMKQGAKLPGNKSYPGMEADAVTAALVLSREDATPEQKKEAREAIRAYSSVTEGMELYEVAAETDQLDKLGTEEGKQELQKIVDTRKKNSAFVDRVVGKDATRIDRERVEERLKLLQQATGDFTDSQRKAFADSLKIVQKKTSTGAVYETYGFDEEGIKRLKAAGLTDEQIQQIDGTADLMAKGAKLSNEKLDEKALMQLTKDAITLPNSNDPIQVLGGTFQDLLQQILQAIKDIFGAIPQQQQ